MLLLHGCGAGAGCTNASCTSHTRPSSGADDTGAWLPLFVCTTRVSPASLHADRVVQTWRVDNTCAVHHRCGGLIGFASFQIGGVGGSMAACGDVGSSARSCGKQVLSSGKRVGGAGEGRGRGMLGPQEVDTVHVQHLWSSIGCQCVELTSSLARVCV